MQARYQTLPRAAVLGLSLGLALPSLGETRSVEGLEFGSVVLIGGGEVEISQGANWELQLRGSASDLDREPFYVSGDGLVLGKSRRSTKNFSDVQYRVVLPALGELRVAGSGTVYVREFIMEEDARFIVDGSGDLRLYGIDAPAVQLRVKGSGDIRAVRVVAEEIGATVNGSGDLYIGSVTAESAGFVVTGSGDLEVTDGGYVRRLEVSVVGSGDARLDDVGSESAKITIVGAGTASVGECESTLEASVLGSGDVRYRGDPKVETTSLGSGEIRRRDR